MLVTHTQLHTHNFTHTLPLGSCFPVFRKAKDGTIASAPRWLCRANIEHLDTFGIVTSACRRFFTYRAQVVQTPTQALAHFAFLAVGGWQAEVLGIINDTFHSPANAIKLTLASRPDLVNKSVEFALLLVGSRACAMINHSDSYPECTASFFRPGFGDDQKAAVLRSFEADFDLLCRCEALALHHRGVKKVLDKIWWASHPVVRLVLETVKLTRCDPGDSTLNDLLRSIHERWPDSKGPEDCHAELRDESRRGRHPGVSKERRMYRVSTSTVMRKRGVAHSVDITDEQIVRALPALKRQKLVNSWKPTPSSWPTTLASIMLPGRSWSSPNPKSTYDAISAWQWLKRWWNSDRHHGVAPTASWRSKLAPPLAVLFDDRAIESEAYSIVTAPLEWGVLVWPCLPSSLPGYLKLESKGKPMKWVFITEPSHINVVPYEAKYVDGFGIMLHIGDPTPFFFGAIEAGVGVAAEELMSKQQWVERSSSEAQISLLVLGFWFCMSLVCLLGGG